MIIEKTSFKTAIESRSLADKDAKTAMTVNETQVNKLEVNMNGQTATIYSATKGKTSTLIDTEDIRSQLVGKKKDDGLKLINMSVKDSSSSVEQVPAWWPNKNFPYSNKYLQVNVKYE